MGLIFAHWYLIVKCKKEKCIIKTKFIQFFVNKGSLGFCIFVFFLIFNKYWIENKDMKPFKALVLD